ncbi:Cytochrome c oxidase protein 20-like protein [Trichoplax sp. H2]|uniref:Cytochrome c oxidase assembly protein COX20, mitochondrial n=1 Tax=Trichoplax adhaerens TaxID=10228 RepID=B3RZ02_TRIAD|nr:hypothetical protein TRIADDRAFT_57278 [Trichoplax adhaerens]EDV24116.1 hypothetical protein TRIADDRAFT_57278 [Trichoplax adhaerens]RDD40736.1 Cytochrome c oxidase protein 20-like protein [Trichoplax sp. H2]|eukprot:XP_002113642.1 hypothetical protein TRIADDRAFT_57278 [Trichoplax adhaerens]
MDKVDNSAKPARKQWWHFDYQKVPCARSSLLYGISGGLVVGALVFTRTKIVRRSCDYAVASFAVVSLSFWTYCNYHVSKERARLRKIVGAYQSRVDLARKQSETEDEKNNHQDISEC